MIERLGIGRAHYLGPKISWTVKSEFFIFSVFRLCPCVVVRMCGRAHYIYVGLVVLEAGNGCPIPGVRRIKMGYNSGGLA